MESFRRKVVKQTVAYGRRGGEYRVLTLECGHTVERHSRRIYPSTEEECGRCEHPQYYLHELGLAPTHLAALQRLYREKRIRKIDVSGPEARAMRSLVTKGFAAEAIQPDGSAYYKLPD